MPQRTPPTTARDTTAGTDNATAPTEVEAVHDAMDSIAAMAFTRDSKTRSGPES